jgi:hypothetical protein
MLFVSTNLSNFNEFKEMFKDLYNDKTFLDLSKVPLDELAIESMAIVNHHSNCAIFLGHLEPGFMLDSISQVILRKLIRKFPTGIICKFTESLPFSWKNEIDTLYIQKPLNSNGSTSFINDGSSLQNKSQI